MSIRKHVPNNFQKMMMLHSVPGNVFGSISDSKAKAYLQLRGDDIGLDMYSTYACRTLLLLPGAHRTSRVFLQDWVWIAWLGKSCGLTTS